MPYPFHPAPPTLAEERAMLALMQARIEALRLRLDAGQCTAQERYRCMADIDDLLRQVRGMR